MFVALAYAFVNGLEKALEGLIDSDVAPTETKPTLNYFEDCWHGRPDNKLK